jgi:Xaa-Pro aminopeptidase
VTPQLRRLLSKLREEGIDSLLITRDVNISYLTDFDSQDSWILIVPKSRIYITDFRYLQEVKDKISGFKVYRINGSIFKSIADLSERFKLKRLFFEAKNISYAEMHAIKSFLRKRKIDFIPTYDLVESIRAIKSRDEIGMIKNSLNLTISAFAFIKRVIRAGIKESEVAIKLENFVRRKGAKLAFEPIIASGRNSAYPHAKISNRIISRDDSILVDVGVDLKGYKSDLTRMFFLGRIPLSLRRIYNIVLQAQLEATNRIKAGSRASEIDKSARNFLVSKRLGKYFGHALGHGIGREVHEFPSISSKNDTPLKEGMVFTVEPAVYIPGRFGVRVEDIILVKKNNCEVLSAHLDKSD